MSWTPISSAYVFASVEGENRPIGVIRKTDAGFEFGYAQSWLAFEEAFSVDPINLPLSPSKATSQHLWGCFVDATPDDWGRKVILATHKQAPANEIEWLLATRGTGVGCLSFSASRTTVLPHSPVPSFTELEQLLGMADEIDRGVVPEHLDDALAKLLTYGSSMGGARPKITVAHEGQEWIAKLSRRNDPFNHPRAEYASMAMAADAGIPVPETRLECVGDHAVLLVRRFDREDDQRAHYLSAYSLIAPQRMRPGDVEGPVSYLRLASVIKKISHDSQGDLRDLFRRMVFNIAIANTDDHLKNHGFLHLGSDRYMLSPAFDLIPHLGQTSAMALIVGRFGQEATFDNALSMCDRFGLTTSAAVEIVQEVATVASRAGSYFRDAGVAPLDAAILAAACNRPGARLDATEAKPRASKGLSQ